MSAKRPLQFCAIDAEGDAGETGLLGVAFYDGESGLYVTSHDHIRRALIEYAELGYTFIAHNAEYDLGVIFWQLDIPMKAVYYNGRFNRGEWKYHPRKPLCQLWDTLALSGGISLERLGKALQLPKYPTPQRLLGSDPDRYSWKCDKHNEWECEVCYAVRDAEICYRFMSGLSDTVRAWGVEPHRRLSGLASHVWRVLDHPSPIQLSDRRAIELSRASYHGGRVETFKLGTVYPCYTSDVTSMYPACMSEVAYPSPDTMVYVQSPQSWEYIYTYEGVMECEIIVPPMYLPPLPLHYGGEIHYPIGRLRGAWTFHELRYAIALGATIRRVHRAAYSTESVHPFTNFIAVLWEMRESFKLQHDPRELFAKLFMNNLYGYLGMRGNLERTDIRLADPNTRIQKQPKTAWYTEQGKLFLTYVRDQASVNKWANVLWASQTTSAARVKLHQYMAMQGSALLYCDTDSVFSSAPIIGAGDGLGLLRADGDYQQITIAAPKLYALQHYERDMSDSWRHDHCIPHHVKACEQCRWYAKAKGVKRDCALAFLRGGVATFSAPIKPRSQGRRGIAAGTWVDITRSYQNTPARRQPVSPASLLSGEGFSDTEPLFVGP